MLASSHAVGAKQEVAQHASTVSQLPVLQQQEAEPVADTEPNSVPVPAFMSS